MTWLDMYRCRVLKREFYAKYEFEQTTEAAWESFLSMENTCFPLL